MDITIQYHLPQGMFNENKRPPGHVCDPLIRQAAKTATKLLEELDLPHHLKYVDQRDQPRANKPIAFYGVQIDLEDPVEGCESLWYGWTRLWGDRVEQRTVLQASLSAGLPRHPRRRGPGDRGMEEERTNSKLPRRWRLPPGA